MNINVLVALSALFSVTNLQTSYAADTLTKKYPSVVLVQIRSEINKIRVFTNEKRYKQLEEVKEDALKVKNAMINDFTNHFSYCPVYYFIDTNIELVKQRKFEGILFNSDSAVVNPKVINDTNYLIVYYGHPVDIQRRKFKTDSAKDKYDSGIPFGKGLVFNNYKFQQITYLVRIIRGGRNNKYRYHSKHFDIEYYELAKRFNDDLNMGSVDFYFDK